MNHFLELVESTLKPLANQYVPEGSTPEAVIHQWVHAIAQNRPLYAAQRGVDAQEIIAALRATGAYEQESHFKAALTQHLPIKPPTQGGFSFIDLFAGIGGMRIGFQQAGGNCVFSSEFEKNAQETYFNNHGDFPFGDITKIPVEDIPDHDVLIGGFPCQPFSHAGLKLGIGDTRGTLFHNIAKIIEMKRPKVALLENVKGLISHDKGYTLQVILRTLTSIGYSCNIDRKIITTGTPKQLQNEAKKMVLRSVDFGVPQNRQRIYIVLWQDGLTDKFEYPAPTHTTTRVGDILEESPDEKYTISDRLWDGHQRRKESNKVNGKGFGFGIVNSDSPYTNTISARYYKDGSEILIEQEGKNPRKLTPREAANLQGFPSEFVYSKSNVQAYKQFGNSVSVPVIFALANQILNSIIKV